MKRQRSPYVTGWYGFFVRNRFRPPKAHCFDSRNNNRAIISATDMTEQQTAPGEINVHSRELSSRSQWKIIVTWIFIAAAALYSAFHAAFVIWNTAHRTHELLDIVYTHYACVVVVPFAGYAALALVLLLEWRSSDPIEFKALGFEFKGPAAPIVLWVLCFLAIVVAIAVTWPLR
jgi:hypothetical protein